MFQTACQEAFSPLYPPLHDFDHVTQWLPQATEHHKDLQARAVLQPELDQDLRAWSAIRESLKKLQSLCEPSAT
ncbi:hypothetical protein C8J56DRAFT_1046479 [Mycena floridula]|nr:hypothetical protein C8J56DRAFT_1046479 [Mycena floridula]